MKNFIIIFASVLAVILMAVFVVFFISVHPPGADKEAPDAQQTEQPTEEPTEKPTEKPTEPPFTGYKIENGIRYYYLNGEKQFNTVVGSEDEGYRYVGEDGLPIEGYCNGVTANGADWIVIESEAYPVKTESDKLLFIAAKDIFECTSLDMTREEKLKAAFDYIRTKYREGSLHDPAYPPTNSDWHLIYASDIFVNGRGDCYSFGAAFAFMARAIGYTEAYACNSTGHGWTEVENRIYDPEWSLHSKNYSYYAMSYDDECDVPYKGAMKVGKEYKRRQITVN